LVASGAVAAAVGLSPETQKKVEAQVRETIIQLERTLEGRNGKRFKRVSVFTTPTTLDQIYDMPYNRFDTLTRVGPDGLNDMKIDPRYFQEWQNYFSIFLRGKGFVPNPQLSVGQNLEEVFSESIRKSMT
jgi:hypothetical protein